MIEFLPKHSETKLPLWTDTKEGFLISIDKAEILIPKPRKNAKKATIQLKNGPSFELKKENWDSIIPCCRFLVKLRKAAGDHKIQEITIDTPDKGRFFISEAGVGFKWLTDSERNFI